MSLAHLIAALLIAFWFYCVGAVQAFNFKDRAAVAAGVAYWAVDAEGKVKLEYNK